MKNKEKEVHTFVSLLKYFGIFQPESSYKIVCPFHNDKNASLQINVDDCYFFCYAECGAKGGSLELYKAFYKLHHGKEISDLKALKEISKIANKKKYSSVDNIVYNNIYIDEDESEENNLEKAKDFYFNLKQTNWFKVKDEEIIEAKRYMKKRGFKSSTLNKVKAKATYNSKYPIVFPMFDNEVFSGYVMRTTNKEIEKERKYMYNKGFRRRTTLAGNYSNSFPLIVVEGFLDKIAANQLGIKNIVAILGWKISSQQFEKLKKAKIKTIICGLDNDEAGNKGYKYLKRICSTNGMNVLRIHYPKGIKDFGDLLNNKEAANKVISQVKSFCLQE